MPLAALPRGAALTAERRPELFGGAVAIAGEGRVTKTADWNGALYRPSPPAAEPARLTAIPYYLWCNRGPGEMRVWLPEA